jgi:hypothetical protein
MDQITGKIMELLSSGFTPEELLDALCSCKKHDAATILEINIDYGQVKETLASINLDSIRERASQLRSIR